MRQKILALSPHLLIFVLAGLIFLLILQGAQAQSGTPQQQNQFGNAGSSAPEGGNTVSGNIMSMKMPQKSLVRRMIENTDLNYYQQFLGPTMSGPSSETYNVFQEGIDQPGTGRAPVQSFHSVNLRHHINHDWAVGASLAAVNGYSDPVDNKAPNGFTVTNRPDHDFFNARAYVSLPSFDTKLATFYTTLSYEHPTSNISKEDEMKFGYVVAQLVTLKLPSLTWSAGLNWQYYRLHYENNVVPVIFDDGSRGTPRQLQTTIISGGPFLNYRISDRWQAGSSLTFDWDQRGVQDLSREYNNNLPHRGRVSLTYFPAKLKYLSNVGVFSQALLKFRPETTAFGAEMAMRF